MLTSTTKRVFSFSLCFIFIFVLSTSAFATSPNDAEQKIKEVSKKYHGHIQLLDKNEERSFKASEKYRVNSIEELDKKISEIEKDADFLMEAINNSKQGQLAPQKGIQPFSSGMRTISEWFPQLPSGTFVWLNTTLNYTYVWGVNPIVPLAPAHNYFSSGDAANIYLTGIDTVLWGIQMVSAPQWQIGDSYETGIPTLKCSYTYLLKIGIPTPWGTIGYTTSNGTHSVTTSSP